MSLGPAPHTSGMAHFPPSEIPAEEIVLNVFFAMCDERRGEAAMAIWVCGERAARNIFVLVIKEAFYCSKLLYGHRAIDVWRDIQRISFL